MYVSYFSLNEPPFSITPDPRFVYLSGRHREALAHLLYGVGSGGGFVLLTGEVGTGKTTVCRYVLDHLPSEVDVALILNPRLTAVELLATVCDELRVPYPEGTTSLKLLVDGLSRRLLEAHARGRRTVLIIDEAQNLSVEVLEQVRLLTNLETPKDKLLQIILIGQPELTRLLERKDLRQLAQRVTARYHLMPFGEQETRAYITHRMKIAGAAEPLFEPAAVREVHRRSRGVPRLINVICDRALLGAYGTGQPRVGAAVVRRAAREVLAPGRRVTVPPALWLSAAAALLLVVSAAAVAPHVAGRLPDVAAALRWKRAAAVGEPAAMLPESAGAPGPGGAADAGTPIAAIVAGSTAAPPPAAADPPAAAASATPPASPPAPVTAVAGSVAATSLSAVTEAARPAQTAGLRAILRDARLPRDRASAFASLYALWRVDYRRGEDGRMACEAGRPAGLRCLFKRGTWTVLKRFDLPAILELTGPAGDRSYATVTTLGQTSATLAFGRQQFTLPLHEIEEVWDGAFILVWKPPAVSAAPIVPGARGRDVAWLRHRLAEIDGSVPARGGDVYDAELQGRLVAFQRQHGLVPDGIVGEETLLRLGAVGDASVPSLAPAR
jgi:general secretion pathway protein A